MIKRTLEMKMKIENHCNWKKKKQSISFISVVLILVVTFASPALLVADGIGVSDENLPFEVDYTSSVNPGDAVFITLTLNENTSSQFSAQAKLYSNGVAESLIEVELYKIGNKAFSAVIPLSSWYEAGEFYLRVSYQIGNDAKKTFDLSLTMNKKDFISETLYLDARNTSIKTDTSTERAVQIDRLNEILETVDYSAVYQKGTFSFPIDQVYYTSFFGDRRIYEYSDGKSATGVHYGSDYRAAIGTPVYACGRGKVVLAAERNSTGFTVVLEHLPGLYSLYYHLDSYSVSEGQIVEQGVQIAESGATGLATGPHLHWEIRLLTRAVNPEFFIDQFPTQ